MQYIFKNYRSFIRYNTPLFILSMGIIMVSVLLIHFIYGVYQNYNIIQSGDYDQVEGFDEFSFEFSSKKGKEVTKSDMDRCIKQISNKMDLIEGSGNSNFVVLIVYSPLNCNIPKGIESKDTSIKVAINRSGVSAPDIVFDNMQTYSFTDGSRWSDIQEKEGAQVTLFWNYKNPQYQIEGVHPEDAINADNTVTIEGKDYKIIGYPCADSNGFYFQPYHSFGICSQTKNVDGAWDFLRTFISKDFQTEEIVKHASYYIPTRKDVFERMLKDFQSDSQN